MKIIKEDLGNIKTELDNKDVVATIDAQQVDAEKEDQEKDEMMHGAKIVKNTKAFLGAKKQPVPKEPELAKVTLEESLFEDYIVEGTKYNPEEKDIFWQLAKKRMTPEAYEELQKSLHPEDSEPEEENEAYDPKEEDKAEAEGAAIGTAAGIVAGQAIPGPVDDIALGALGGAIGGVGGKHLYRKSSGYYDKVDEEYDSSSPAVKKIYELLNNGMSADLILRMCLKYMSNDQLTDMLNKNGIELDESMDSSENLNLTEDAINDDERDMTVYDLWTLVYDDLVGDLGGHSGGVKFELPDKSEDRYSQDNISIDGNDIIVHAPDLDDLAFAYKVAQHYGVETELKHDTSPLTKETSRYQLKFIIPEETMNKHFRKRGRKLNKETVSPGVEK